MLKNKEKLWQFLNDFEISRFAFHIQEKDIIIKDAFEVVNGISIPKPMKRRKGDITNAFIDKLNSFLILSPFYAHFAVSINRAISFYPEIIKLQDTKDYFNPKTVFLFNSIHILLISALEVYLLELFRGVASQLRINDLDSKLLIKFLKVFNMKERFLNVYAERGHLDYLLSEILPERLDFQQKRKTKIAYKLIGFRVIEMVSGLWERIFSRSNGHIGRRHRITHSGPNDLIEVNNIKDFNLNRQIEIIENEIIDIVQFVFYIETQRLFNYPDQFEMGIIDNFPKNRIKNDIKRRVIYLNFDILTRYIQIYQQGGFTQNANEFRDMLKKFK